MWEDYIGKWNIFCEPFHAPKNMQSLNKSSQRRNLPGKYVIQKCIHGTYTTFLILAYHPGLRNFNVLDVLDVAIKRYHFVLIFADQN